jgi:hypothetical protein
MLLTTAASAVLLLTTGLSASSAAPTKQPESLATCTPATWVRDEKIVPPGSGPSVAAVAHVFRTSDGSEVGTMELPKNWTPTNATDAELKTFGFPKKPKDSAERVKWDKTYSNFKGSAVKASDAPCVSDQKRWWSRDISGGYNYAGIRNVSSYNRFAQTTGILTLPRFDNNTCGSSSAVSFWVGTSNQNTSTNVVIDQSGIDVGLDGSTYRFWVEAYPQDLIWYGGNSTPANMPWQAGDEIQINQWYDAARVYGWAWNLRTGQTWTMFQPNAQYGGTAAEYVTERIGNRPIRNFGTAQWRNVQSVDWNGTYNFFQLLDYNYYLSTWATSSASATLGRFSVKWQTC